MNYFSNGNNYYNDNEDDDENDDDDNNTDLGNDNNAHRHANTGGRQFVASCFFMEKIIVGKYFNIRIASIYKFIYSN